MQTYIESLLVKHVKLSSIDEALLQKKRAGVEECLEFTKSLAKDLSGQSSNAQFVEGIGIFVIITSLVSDVIRDTLGKSLSAEYPLMKMGLSQIYDKARDSKWRGNRYEKIIEGIKKNGGHLEALAKLDKTGMVVMVITVHKNMLANAVGLVGFLEDARESRMVLANSIKSLQENIEKLKQLERQTQYYLETGDGGETQQRFTLARPAQSSGRLH